MMNKRIMLALLASMGVAGAVSAAAVARVYVSRVWSASNNGILTYLVDENGTWTYEKRFIAQNASSLNVRPGACVKVGEWFYVLDQFADPGMKFSIHKYDRYGHYRGTLVNQYTSSINVNEGNRRDNVQIMTPSRDGQYLYLATWQVNPHALMLRVTVADGTVTEFQMPDVKEGASVCTGPDGTVYVAARNSWQVRAYDPDDFTKPVRSYPQRLASAVFYDDETDRLFVGSHFNTGGEFLHCKVDGSDRVSITNTLAYYPHAIVRVGNKICFGTWDGNIVAMNPADGSMSVLFGGLGNVNHLFVEKLPVSEPIASPAAHTSLVAKDGTFYFAADNAASAEGDTAVSTVWKSTDGGTSWTSFATFSAAHPSLFVYGSNLSVFFEPNRTTDEKQYFSIGDIAADGTFTPSFSVTNETGELLTPANGSVVPSHWGFAGGRTGIGFSTPTARTSAAFTFFTTRTSDWYPDPCLTGIHTNQPHSMTPRNAIVDTLPPVLATGPENGHANYYQELVPVVQRYDSGIPRVGPEYVLKTSHLNPNNAADYSPKYPPTPTDFIPMPGGSKEFAYFYDAASASYWAVTMPVTNAALLAEYEQTEVRNVLALYASPDLRDWRLCRILREEGTPSTVAFARPNVVVDGDDLLVVYATAGADNTARTTIGGQSFVSMRVPDFRATLPAARDPEEGYLIVDYGATALRLYTRDPATDAWSGRTIVTNGTYGGYPFRYLSGTAVHRDRVYVTSETIGVFAFDVKGRFRTVYPLPSGTRCDALAVSPDGTYLLVSDSSWLNNSNGHNTIRRLDLDTGTWTTLASKADDSTCYCVRGLCFKSDGSFFAASRDSGFVRHYTADGSSYTTIATLANALSVALDDDESHLFVGTRCGEVRKIDLSDNSAVVLTPPLTEMKESGAFSISFRDGRLWVSDGAGCLVFTLDPDTPYQAPQPVMSGFHFAGRGMFVDFDALRGTMILIR